MDMGFFALTLAEWPYIHENLGFKMTIISLAMIQSPTLLNGAYSQRSVLRAVF